MTNCSSAGRTTCGLKRLGAIRMGLEQWRLVLELADRLIAVNGEEIAGRTMAAIAHHELKHYDQAATAGMRVLELDSKLERMPLPKRLFWNNLAVDLIAGGRTDEARAVLTRAGRHARRRLDGTAGADPFAAGGDRRGRTVLAAGRALGPR